MKRINPDTESDPVQASWSLPRGRLLRRALRSDPTLEYEVYVPTTGAVGAPVLVSVHGMSRSVSAAQAAALVPACERHGVTLLAPSFHGESHADYQRLGREGRGQRADLFLHRCLQELTSLTGGDASQIRLFGHSGGAQFAHRYLMAYPHRVVSAVVVAAGWYTLPDPALKFPFGIQSNRRLPGVLFDSEAYLGVPVTVLVGALDTQSFRLRSDDRVTSQQGANRVERARTWVAAMQAQAAAHSVVSRVDLVEIPEVGHAFADLCHQGKLIERTFHALFDAPFIETDAFTAMAPVAATGRGLEVETAGRAW